MRKTLLPCLLAFLLLGACGTDESGLDELSAPGTSGSGGSSAGQGGSSAGSGGGGQGGGSSGKGGTSVAGSSGAGGDGGSDAGSGGASAGAGGSNTGSGGSDAGAGGNAAGSGGASAGAGGSEAGSGGSDAGAGGSDAGSGGSDAGAGGSDAGSGGSDAGQGGSDAGSGGSDAGSGGSAGAGGGPVDCGSGFTEGCGGCLEKSCCAEAAACGANCKACLLGDVTGKDCANDAEVKALRACSEASCKAECVQGNGGPPVCSVSKPVASGGSCVTTGSNGFTCNPITGGGCTGAGAACDINNNNNGFVCYGSGNTEELCEACGSGGDYCQSGFTCIQGQCQAYCCDDGDCNGGICDKQKISGPGKGVVGICSEPLFSGVDLCAADLHEVNNTANTAEVLAPQDDCSFQNNLVITGALSPSGDQDWFRADFVDTNNNQCAFEPIFRFQGNAGIRVCAYFKCKNGSTTAGQQVQCSQSDSSSSNPFGPGCCTTDGNLTPQLNCTGDDDSAEVLVRVDSGSSNACLPYRIRYGY